MPLKIDDQDDRPPGSVVADRLAEETALAERARREGRLDEAENILVTSLYEAERLGAHETQPLAAAAAWELLGRVRVRSGAPDVAVSAFERAASARQRAGDVRGTGDVLLRIARTARRAGDHARCASALGDAEKAYDRSDHREGIGRVAAERARLAFEKGDLTGALRGFERVRELANERGDRLADADAANDLGNVLAATGDLSRAIDLYADAERIFDELGATDGLQDCRRNAARARAALDAVVSPEDSEPPPGATWAPRGKADTTPIEGDAVPSPTPEMATYLEALTETARLCGQAAASGSLDEALGIVLATTLRLLGADRGAVLEMQETGKLRFRTGLDASGATLGAEEMTVSRTITGSVAKTGRGLWVSDLRVDPQFAASSSIQEQGLAAAMAAPLRLPKEDADLLAQVDPKSSATLSRTGTLLGVLYVDSRRAKRFAETDFLLFDSVAAAAAQAIRTARLQHALRAEKATVEELNTKLSSTVRRQEQELVVARAERDRVRHELALRHDYTDIVWASPKMRDVLRLLDRVTETNLPVLIHGESGTGKELLARAIHRNGPRAKEPFVSVNCAAISGNLLESELFGHMRGAFTGAQEDRPGLFELADSGTLFLDEVGDMPLEMQSRLLRALQEGEIRRVGGKEIIQVDVRAIAATHRDLRDMTSKGEFREDLYYRLNVITVNVPPLRERRDDVGPLTYRILETIARGDNTDGEGGGTSLRLEKKALGELVRHDWPGNVRELENALRCLATFANDGVITHDATSRYLEQARSTGEGTEGGRLATADGSLRDIERLVIDERLRLHGWRQTETAKSLGIDRKTLYRKIKEYGLRPDKPTR